MLFNEKKKIKKLLKQKSKVYVTYNTLKRCSELVFDCKYLIIHSKLTKLLNTSIIALRRVVIKTSTNLYITIIIII